MRPRRLTRPLAAVATALILSGGWPSGVASASGRDPNEGSGHGDINESGDPTAIAVDPGTPGGSTPGDGSDCYWKVIIEDDTDYPFWAKDGTKIYSKTGRWVRQYCNGEATTINSGYWYWAVPEGGPVIPGELAQEAAESAVIVAPEIGTSPGSGRLVVHVPTWLWVDGDWWESYSATATAGRVSATVTATPVRAVWSTGDGATVVCDAGVAWQPGLAEDASSCTHTYTHASNGSTLSVTVELELAWSSNVGDAGTLPTISRTGSQVVQVGEIQAIGTR